MSNTDCARTAARYPAAATSGWPPWPARPPACCVRWERTSRQALAARSHTYPAAAAPPRTWPVAPGRWRRALPAAGIRCPYAACGTKAGLRRRLPTAAIARSSPGTRHCPAGQTSHAPATRLTAPSNQYRMAGRVTGPPPHAAVAEAVVVAVLRDAPQGQAAVAEPGPGSLRRSPGGTRQFQQQFARLVQQQHAGGNRCRQKPIAQDQIGGTEDCLRR